MRRKKSILLENIEITDIAAEGRSIARVDNMVVFVPHAIPGDVVDIRIIRKRKRYMEGIAVKYHLFSPMRLEPFCKHFGECGGCSWQQLPYSEQLKFKQKQVADQLERIGNLHIREIKPVIPSEIQTGYRNKLEFAFSENRWLTRDEIGKGLPLNKGKAAGFHIPGRFDKVLDIQKCYLQPEPSNAIRNHLREYALKRNLEFFDLVHQRGFLRNVTIRNNRKGEFMVIISFYKDDKALIFPLLESLKQSFTEIVSLFYVINTKANDAVTDLEHILYFGEDHLTEEMEGLKFRIGPKSFYQTNPIQAQKLYDVARDFAGLTGNEIVYDLYTGTGTIALFIARHCLKVKGIEFVDEAIDDARKNAELNNITNVEFFAGDSRKILTNEFMEEQGYPDVIIADPPRSGMHADVVKAITESNARRIVYVSCNPATQARDIKLMSDKYDLACIQPVDMFPHTTHVENVALLEKK